MSRLFKGIVLSLIASVALLLGGGLLLDAVMIGGNCNETFYSYRVYALGDAPYWFISVLFLVAVNGYWIPGLARIVGNSQFSPFRQNGIVTWDIPIQYGILLGKNLVLVCATLFFFLVIQNPWF